MAIESSDLRGWISRCPVIAILRGIRPDEAEFIGDALEEAGVTIVEVPLNSPDPFQSIGTLARVFGDRMLIGAGTLTDPAQVTEVARAGGRLIVTPHAELSIIRAAKQAGLFAVPGFFNPTEAFALLKAGADAIKLFPAEVVGPSMLKALKAVLPKDALVIPVGGIDKQSIAAWMAAGANGFGAGSSIYRPGDDAKTVKQKAKVLVDAVRTFNDIDRL
ncbi:2-dehydro-3-deoxy-6-phosphogalactonate aldolase [Edaphobacter modestus]|uniref:2-keto-3-deoxy-phosphogalactonate aldolase n=1 Tax=Edaphobacter modestus TaxID=388466 RepID=A0A4Q7YZ61_9BACT|nr:2-dehydro-3-deoxy-6-phosphogalactonate aldolase [Edaphobacter modestus]RZU43197.1 2-keto-3-deoxy-phosphogalactonate aldolase [Edaphobacter modestus]